MSSWSRHPSPAVAVAIGLGAATAAAVWLQYYRKRKQRQRDEDEFGGADGEGAGPSLAEEILEALGQQPAGGDDDALTVELTEEELLELFEGATAFVNKRGGELPNQLKLGFYGCYKQATVGDAPADKPWGIEAGMKWSAWNQQRGGSKEGSMLRYVQCLQMVAPQWRQGGGFAADATAGSEAEGGGSGFGVSVSTMGRIGDPAEADDVDETPVGQLCEKIALGETEQVFAILRRNPQLASQADKDGMTPLHWAADRGDLEVARKLVGLSSGDVNARDDSGDAPLHYAVNTDNLELAKLLIAARADPSLSNEDGETPLKLAEGQDEWLALLR